MPTLKFIFTQLKTVKSDLCWGISLLILTNLIGIIIPIKIKQVVDLLIQKNFSLSKEFWLLTAFILGLALLMALVRIGSRVFIFGIGRKLESKEKQRFFEHLLTLDYQYFTRQKTGDLISRATNDIQAIRQMMGFGILNIINIIWVYAFTLPLMFSLSLSVSFFVILCYLPILAFVYYLSFRLKTLQEQSQTQIGELSSFLEEDLSGIQVIKSYSQEAREIFQFKSLNQIYLKISLELAKWRSIIWPVLDLAKGVSFFVLLYFTAFQNLSAGTIAALLVCIERLVFPTTIMGWLITIFQKGSVSIERVRAIYRVSSLETQEHELSEKKSKLVIKSNNLKIKKFSFSFGEQKSQVFKDLSLELPADLNFVGIVGSIGSGKSTLTYCLLRLLAIEQKKIFVSEQDLRDCELFSLREEISLVPQEPFLFNCSIEDNLSLFSELSSEESLKTKIAKVSQICEIEAEIAQMRNGLKTIVGEKGVSLSGGQAQRISLARALLLKPRAKILILDDSLSSIDNEVALKILCNLRKYLAKQAEKCLLILITHRLSLLREAELIYLLSEGKLKEQGSHKELLERSEEYQKLCFLEQ